MSNITDMLIPCPFCNKNPHEAQTGDGRFIIKCYECGVEMIQDRKDKVCETWNKRATVNENKVNDIAENEYLDLTDLTALNENDKREFIQQVCTSCAKELLKTFLGFKLNDLIEIVFANDNDKKKYVLTFQTKEQFEKRFFVNERKDSSEAIEILKELVFLKKSKDLNGKDSVYLERQPAAWKAANKFLESQ